jgi:hypothetical protein
VTQKIYADTSVIGGCDDPEFRVPSLALLSHFISGLYRLVISDLTLHELARAPNSIRAHLNSVPESHLEVISFDGEAANLAEAYISSGVLGAAVRVDAQHIATATVAASMS